jgi:hypothetical protein
MHATSSLTADEESFWPGALDYRDDMSGLGPSLTSHSLHAHPNPTPEEHTHRESKPQPAGLHRNLECSPVRPTGRGRRALRVRASFSGPQLTLYLYVNLTHTYDPCRLCSAMQLHHVGRLILRTVVAPLPVTSIHPFTISSSTSHGVEHVSFFPFAFTRHCIRIPLYAILRIPQPYARARENPIYEVTRRRLPEALGRGQRGGWICTV